MDGAVFDAAESFLQSNDEGHSGQKMIWTLVNPRGGPGCGGPTDEGDGLDGGDGWVESDAGSGDVVPEVDIEEEDGTEVEPEPKPLDASGDGGDTTEGGGDTDAKVTVDVQDETDSAPEADASALEQDARNWSLMERRVGELSDEGEEKWMPGTAQ